jgi:hypothetical protein
MIRTATVEDVTSKYTLALDVSVFAMSPSRT